MCCNARTLSLSFSCCWTVPVFVWVWNADTCHHDQMQSQRQPCNFAESPRLVFPGSTVPVLHKNCQVLQTCQIVPSVELTVTGLLAESPNAALVMDSKWKNVGSQMRTKGVWSGFKSQSERTTMSGKD